MLDIKNAKFVETKRSKSGSTYKTFTFECSNCGIDIKSQSSQLKRHSGKCRSCSQKGRPYEFMLNELTRACRKRKNIEINITYDDFIETISSFKCHYCNKDLILNKHTRSSNGENISRAYQLDRKDNNLGYTKENVVPCCWDCNRIKSDIYSYEDFMKLSPILKEIHNK